MSKRVTVYKNLKSPEGGMLVNIAEGMTWDTFLEMGARKLSMNIVKRVFLKNGSEVTDMDAMRDGDTLYLSAGEAFHASKGTGIPLKKVCVIGSGAVGKSALTMRFIRSVFLDYYDPTIEDEHRHQTEVDGRVLMVDILDTAGQEEFYTLRPQWMKGKDGYLFVFSLTSRHSLENLQEFYTQLLQLHHAQSMTDAHPPILVVGNKADLKAERKVAEEEGRNLAASFQAADYIETSAKTGQNVPEMFKRILREILKNEKSAKKKTRNFCHFL
eukprot:TRINITY_DN8316_c0_g4_i1.p1 TRINITY_DN8316_c0_g4~~TRINITY_DN8316_c0_g4_i1.p1  ORF type:complete len:271 (+),score=62.45 TRINITY_DN8316_c0_g4_i1:281-1093(+)